MLPHGEGGIRASPRTRKAVLTGILARITVDFVCLWPLADMAQRPNYVRDAHKNGVEIGAWTLNPRFGARTNDEHVCCSNQAAQSLAQQERILEG